MEPKSDFSAEFVRLVERETEPFQHWLSQCSLDAVASRILELGNGAEKVCGELRSLAIKGNEEYSRDWDPAELPQSPFSRYTSSKLKEIEESPSQIDPVRLLRIYLHTRYGFWLGEVALPSPRSKEEVFEASAFQLLSWLGKQRNKGVTGDLRARLVTGLSEHLDEVLVRLFLDEENDYAPRLSPQSMKADHSTDPSEPAPLQTHSNKFETRASQSSHEQVLLRLDSSQESPNGGMSRVYVIENKHLGAVKIGITADWGERQINHENYGWQYVGERPFRNARFARSVEKYLLREFCDAGACPFLDKNQVPQGGWTETIDASLFPVQKVLRMLYEIRISRTWAVRILDSNLLGRSGSTRPMQPRGWRS